MGQVSDVGASHTGDSEGAFLVFRSQTGEELTAYQLLYRLYARIPRETDAFLRRVLETVQELSESYGLSNVSPTVSGHGIMFMSAGQGFVCIELPSGTAAPRGPAPTSLQHLRFLESVGHAVCSMDAQVPRDVPHIHWMWYDHWTAGGKQGLHYPKLNATVADRNRRSDVSELFRLLECYRKVSGAVGLYWLLPLLYAMERGECGWTAAAAAVSERTIRPCPDASFFTTKWRRQSSPVLVCDGLPAGCAIEILSLPAGGWDYVAPLVGYCLHHQCQVLAGDDVRDPQRQWAPRTEHTLMVTPAQDELAVCLVAGLPLATMAWRVDVHGDFYVVALCSVTKSRGGSILIEFLRERLPAKRDICLEAGDDVLGFYETTHGFYRDHQGMWRWNREGTRREPRAVVPPTW